MRNFSKIIFFLLVLAIVSGCASKRIISPYPRAKAYKVYGKTYRPYASVGHHYVEVGMASWYGPGFHGKRTASGEIYNMYAYTAAHKFLPLQTRVRVTNLENGKQVIVRINDRGPFVKGRIIDLSYAAAKRLGMIPAGVARVKIETLGNLDKYKLRGRFYVQVGAFVNKDNALSLKRQLESKGYFVRVSQKQTQGHIFWRVQIGPFTRLSTAEMNSKKLENRFPDCFIFSD
ncbi:MAG: septal ring lytic transglycosylase RlpA family protein [Desulfonauticus sp.]|nr:septal ring lytic transglycosylase RlpA family protein [Desulfonauticus sp.]